MWFRLGAFEAFGSRPGTGPIVEAAVCTLAWGSPA